MNFGRIDILIKLTCPINDMGNQTPDPTSPHCVHHRVIMCRNYITKFCGYIYFKIFKSILCGNKWCLFWDWFFLPNLIIVIILILISHSISRKFANVFNETDPVWNGKNLYHQRTMICDVLYHEFKIRDIHITMCSYCYHCQWLLMQTALSVDLCKLKTLEMILFFNISVVGLTYSSLIHVRKLLLIHTLEANQRDDSTLFYRMLELPLLSLLVLLRVLLLPSLVHKHT